MTPKEKAIELIESMTFHCYECGGSDNAKQCALIAVDEVIEATIDDWSHYEYWQEVKTELQKLY